MCIHRYSHHPGQHICTFCPDCRTCLLCFESQDDPVAEDNAVTPMDIDSEPTMVVAPLSHVPLLLSLLPPLLPLAISPEGSYYDAGFPSPVRARGY